MGILDDAIREHLDLKRQHGADDSEVKHLEDEAFGPPTRPGEPDFPESQEEPALGGAAAADVSADTDLGPAAESGSEDATALLDTQPPATATEPSPVEPSEPAVEPPPASASPEPDPPVGEGSAPDPAQAESPPADTAAFYDQSSGDALDLDELDLDLDDEDVSDLMADDPAPPEPDPAPSHADEPLPAEAPPPPPAPREEALPEDPPISALETVEHPIEEALAAEVGVEIPAPPVGDDVLDPAPAVDELPPDEPPPGEGPPGEELPPETEGDVEDDDVLEGTPEFLQDQPEDDELWFEQGEPKDFDF